MQPRTSERVEKLVMASALAWALVLNLSFFVSAGPLWRDEANSVLQAGLPTLNAVRDSLRYDSFPLLYPAILRGWIGIPALNSDSALRFLGLLTGLAVLVSIYSVCRLLRSRLPVIALVLLAVDPILVSETCSVRPYGLTLVALLWAFASFGICLENLSPRWFFAASAASIVAVQLSYSSALFIAVFGLSAAVLAARRGQKRLAFVLLAPGALAALTLLPYRTVLERARDWAMLLHYRVDWAQFFRSFVETHTIVPLLAWGMFLVLACLTALPAGRKEGRTAAHTSIMPYAVCVAGTGLLLQVLFVEFMRVPPFPRYFLPAVLFVGVALQLVLGRRRRTSHAVLAAVTLGLTAYPAWNWLGLQRTNIEEISQTLARESRPEDLVVLSPWFLHPSFQRYYNGAADWITVPDLPRSPITRYDLFLQAMLRSNGAEELSRRISRTLLRGGRLWLVCQATGHVPDHGDRPELPTLSPRPDGEDYVRCRSYWEREIWFLLRSCCFARELPVSTARRVWDEERLQLILWNPAGQ